MITKIKDMNKVYVHTGKFTFDDVVSAVLIKMINPTIEIIRDDNPKDIDNKSYKFSIKGSDFNYIRRNKRDNYGADYSLTSYVWENLNSDLLDSFGIMFKEEAKEYFYYRYVKMLTIYGNKDYYKYRIYGEKKALINFNIEWYEECYLKSSSDEAFMEAIDIASIFVENWFRRTKEEIDYREIEDEIWTKAEQDSEDGICYLEKKIAWKNQVKKNPDTKVKIVIYESERGYSVVSTNTDEILIKDSEYLDFVHPSMFMGTAKTLNNAIQAARYCLI